MKLGGSHSYVVDNTVTHYLYEGKPDQAKELKILRKYYCRCYHNCKPTTPCFHSKSILQFLPFYPLYRVLVSSKFNVLSIHSKQKRYQDSIATVA